jgi:Protein of unknown function (DUF1488)
MNLLAIENIRIDPEIGDGISFMVEIQGIAHRFFVSRETLSKLEGTLLANNHDLLASFDRQRADVRQAISNTLKLGTSHNVTFLKTAFFD